MPSSGQRIVHGKMQNWHLFHVYPALVSCENLIPWSVLKYMHDARLHNNSDLDALKLGFPQLDVWIYFPEVLQTLWNLLNYLRIQKWVVRGGKNQSFHEKHRKISLCLRWRFLDFFSHLWNLLFSSLSKYGEIIDYLHCFPVTEKDWWKIRKKKYEVHLVLVYIKTTGKKIHWVLAFMWNFNWEMLSE